MRQQRRVTHILIEHLEHSCMRTLCGRIIYYPGTAFSMYPDPRYFQHNHPDCQDCLKAHFAKPKGTHE
jgi:hypothetical protein